MSKKFIHGALIGIASAIVALSLHFAGLLDGLEAMTWDMRVRSLAEEAESTEQIRLIFIDQNSLDWAEDSNGLTWPWHRSVYSYIINFCRRSGAKAIIFDMLYTEASLVDQDQLFGSEIAKKKDFVSGIMFGQGLATNWPENIPPSDLAVVGLDSYLVGDRTNDYVTPNCSFPIPEVATNATLLGSTYAVPDDDAIVRRAIPFQVFDNHIVPSLALAGFMAANPGLPMRITDKFFHVGNHLIPLDPDGKTILRYRGPSQTHKTVNAAAVLQSELLINEGGKPTVDPSFFKDKYVFLGVTAPALLDLKPTPISKIYPGVEIHATMLDNLLSNHFSQYIPTELVVFITILLGLIAGLYGRHCATGWQTALAFIIMIPLPFLPAFLVYPEGYWMLITVETTAVTLALVGTVIINYALEGRQKRFIKSAFGQYISPLVIDKLVKHPESLQLGGEARELSIYFSDIQGFTTISESLNPTELTSLLNDYLTEMVTIIYEESGTVDKYEGDAIIAFWNAPLDDPNHAKNAVRATLRCQKRLKELRPKYKELLGKDVFARIGLNTGQVVVGNMGSKQRFNYTFLGDAGNLASRLEGANKQFGTYIMISEFTKNQLSDEFAYREISRIRVVGKNEPVTVFEPMFKEDYEKHKSVINEFAKGLKMFYNGNFREALDAFSGISEQDPPAKAYARKCEQKIANPPENWDGIWEVTEK